MQLFFHPNADNDHVCFSDDDARHLKVLRKKEGDLIDCTNGKGLHAKLKITGVLKNEIICDNISKEYIPHELPFLTVAISPLKNPDRYEWFIEKAVEMGVSRIVPITCKNTEKQKLRIDRVQKKIISAALQSLHFNFATIEDPLSFLDFIKSDLCTERFVAHCYSGQKEHLSTAMTKGKEVSILIGPEGDFSKEEVEEAIRKGYKAISLGVSRLRTETAGIYATSVFSILNYK